MKIILRFKMTIPALSPTDLFVVIDQFLEKYPNAEIVVEVD